MMTFMRGLSSIVLVVLLTLVFLPARAKILWNDPDARTVHATGDGVDILGGALKRTGTNNDALFFKFRVNPLSDVGSEPYFAGLQLFEGNEQRLGVGNAMEAWGYSAFNTADTGPSNAVPGEFNLKSAHPEPANLGVFRPYELVRQGVARTIVFKVQYVPGGDDLVTVWLEPNLSHGAGEDNQPDNITTKFKAKATFDQIRLRHGKGDKGDGGNGWIFSDMAVATSFDDFVVVRFWQTWWFDGLIAFAVLLAVGFTVRIFERRKYLQRLQRAEQERALERERSRIAQDLHDELGSSLTRISLLSGLLRAEKQNPSQVETHAIKLTEAADNTVRALEEIVWAVRPESDSLQSLVDYLAHFANELFEGSPMRCRMDLQGDLPVRPLPPDVRHNIFLIAKEALTNALRHSSGTTVFVQLKVEKKTFKLVIADDGKGFALDSPATNGQHNGLINLRRRAEAVGGRLGVTSEPNKGTRVVFELIFPD